jgi:hypothetical protein
VRSARVLAASHAPCCHPGNGPGCAAADGLCESGLAAGLACRIRCEPDDVKQLRYLPLTKSLFGTRKPQAAKEPSADGRASVEPKYAHRENASVTWTGRGKPPKWVAEHEASGKGRDDLLIAR